MVSSVAYRPDIDGLRAVAVTLVLLFHAELGMTGGFVGVDVFFVISGYLITRLILRDLDQGSFSLADFWTRRIRRIAPAALLVTLVSLVVGGFLMSPTDYEELGRSAIAQPLMVSNVFFWKKTGYFDGPADLKPLLHTWSLAVEEQFYIFFPLLLAFLGRSTRRTLFVTLTAISVVSFAISLWGMQYAASATFFLLPGRIWELMLGSLLCLIPLPEKLSVRTIQAIGLIGVAAIMIPAVCYTSSTSFPGATALGPCLGAAAVMYAGGHARSWIGRGLSWQPLVQIGLMSYSIYLWHWPLLVFLRYRLGSEGFTADVRLFAFLASFAAGYLSWKFVETPFRHGELWRRRVVVYRAFAAATAMTVLLGWGVRQTDGLPQRFTPEMQKMFADLSAPASHHFVSLEDVRANRLPEFGDPEGELRCLVWGDSHAMAILPPLDAACEALGIRGYHATYGGSLPLVDFLTDRDHAAPESYDEAVVDNILANRYDLVILAGYWSRDTEDPRFVPAFQETIQQLREAGVRTLILRDVPIQKDGIVSMIAAPLRSSNNFEDIGITWEEHRSHQLAADTVIDSLVGGEVTVIDPALCFVDENRRCRIVWDGKCLYSDSHHLSLPGAQRLVPLFTETLRDLLPIEAEAATPDDRIRLAKEPSATPHQ